MAELLVTGAAGFVGRRLVRALTERGETVRSLGRSDGDIADPATLDAVPRVEHVYHLAARSFVPESWHDPVGFHRTNVLGTAAVLEYCRRHGASLTFASTYLYGNPEKLPVDESAPVRPSNPYALSKHLAEQLCAFHAETHGLPVTVVRPFNIYGPGQRPEFLIPKIVRLVLAGGPVEVENLAPKRDYLYVDDLVDALVATLGGTGFRVLNLGSGISHSVRDVIDAVQAAAGTKLTVTDTGVVRPNEIQDVQADIGSAERMLDWRPVVPFEQGIERCVAHGRA